MLALPAGSKEAGRESEALPEAKFAAGRKSLRLWETRFRSIRLFKAPLISRRECGKAMYDLPTSTESAAPLYLASTRPPIGTSFGPGLIVKFASATNPVVP